MNVQKSENMRERVGILFTNKYEGIQLIAYGSVTVGLCIALYRQRPFARFSSPSQVPTRFINQRLPLHGIVKQINPSCGSLLMVRHKPLIPLPKLFKQKDLPVKLAGVNVTTNGIAWLQNVVCGKEVTCIPLTKEKQYLDCIVILSEENQSLNIGKEMTKLGFAITNPIPMKTKKDKEVSDYQIALIAAERLAKKNRNGYWHFAIEPSFMWRIKLRINNILKFFATKGKQNI